MLVVLVASLGLTYKFIERRGVVLTSMRIGDLIMDVPRQWSRVGQSPGADARILAEYEILEEFVDPSPANRSLTIFSRAFDQSVLPEAAALHALTTMVDASRHGKVFLRRPSGNWANEQFAGAFVSAVSADADTIHGMAVFTQRDNGQRYWLVYVVGPADEDTMSKRSILEERLLLRVAGSALIAGRERPG